MSRRVCCIDDKYKQSSLFRFFSTLHVLIDLDCWKVIPHERPTFSELLEQISGIISLRSTSNEELYQSLQKDWRQEIQEMFNELKDKEQV